MLAHLSNWMYGPDASAIANAIEISLFALLIVSYLAGRLITTYSRFSFVAKSKQIALLKRMIAECNLSKHDIQNTIINAAAYNIEFSKIVFKCLIVIILSMNIENISFLLPQPFFAVFSILLAITAVLQGFTLSGIVKRLEIYKRMLFDPDEVRVELQLKLAELEE
jgi:hypothetical protein